VWPRPSGSFPRLLTSRSGTGPARGDTSVASRTSDFAQPCGFRAAPRRLMGRAGLEPATLGLRVRPDKLLRAEMRRNVLRTVRIVVATTRSELRHAETILYAHSYTQFLPIQTTRPCCRTRKAAWTTYSACATASRLARLWPLRKTSTEGAQRAYRWDGADVASALQSGRDLLVANRTQRQRTRSPPAHLGQRADVDPQSCVVHGARLSHGSRRCAGSELDYWPDGQAWYVFDLPRPAAERP
jgi:hypothetical protein